VTTSIAGRSLTIGADTRARACTTTTQFYNHSSVLVPRLASAAHRLCARVGPLRLA
jgi:hypothetical protein